jgi:hypothetical protein
MSKNYSWQSREPMTTNTTNNERPVVGDEHPDIYHTDTLKRSNAPSHGMSMHNNENSPSNDYGRDYNTRATSPPPTAQAPGARQGARSSLLENHETEVDYYHNPTELFRWINYRKWGGAWARVQSDPDECATWVVSRHSSDGRILWRHLPLHLVCMQSGIQIDVENMMNDESRDASDSMHPTQLESSLQQKSAHLQQLEKLIEEIIFTYPEAAMRQDDQGMLPLHFAINSANESTCINERILLLLLVTSPAGLLVEDHNGKTPMDLIHEKRSTGVPGVESALRLMNNANLMIQAIADRVQDDASREIHALKQRSENERRASQRIISRLEDELAEEHQRAVNENTSAGQIRVKTTALQEDLHLLKTKYDSIELDLDQVRKERDDLISTNKGLTDKLDHHDEIVSGIRREMEEECADQKRTIASLKSETSTARAMVEAVENQLRSKFTNEQDLHNAVDKLEKKFATLNTNYQKEKKNLLSEIERLKEEKEQAKRGFDDLTIKNKNLQTRNNDLNKNIEDVLFSQSALVAEYDKLLDSSKRYEVRLLESVQIEREGILSSIAKQKKLFEASMEEQKQMIEEAGKKESELAELIAQERKRQHDSVGNIKDEHQQIRSRISGQHVGASRTSKKDHVPSQRRAPSPGLSRQVEKSTNNVRNLEGKERTSGSEMGSKGHSMRFSNTHDHTDSSKFKSYCSVHEIEENESRSQPVKKGLHESQPPQPPSLLGFLEQKSNQHRSPPPPSSSTSFEVTSIPKTQSGSFNSQFSSDMRNRSLGPSFSSSTKEPTSQTTPRKQSDAMSQNTSFSLDDFSDLDSKQSVCADSIGNDYAGMSSAIKKGTIRVNTRSRPHEMGRGNRTKNQNSKMETMQQDSDLSFDPSSMEAIRQRYSKQRNKYAVTDEDSVNSETYGYSMTSNGSDIMPLDR